jgi:hypothetical protein
MLIALMTHENVMVSFKQLEVFVEINSVVHEGVAAAGLIYKIP